MDGYHGTKVSSTEQIRILYRQLEAASEPQLMKDYESISTR